MMRNSTSAGRDLRQFFKDQGGVASIEAILLIPLLFWAYTGTFVMFDAYKKQTDGLRVTYSVADAISREDSELTQAYLDSMTLLSDFMSRSPNRVTQRVTIVCYSAEDDQYQVAWSRTTGPKKSTLLPHTDLTVDDNRDRLPILPVGDQVVLVETFMDYAPVWSVGLAAQTFDYWVFTRPRFTNQVKHIAEPTGVCALA